MNEPTSLLSSVIVCFEGTYISTMGGVMRVFIRLLNVPIVKGHFTHETESP